MKYRYIGYKDGKKEKGDFIADSKSEVYDALKNRQGFDAITRIDESYDIKSLLNLFKRKKPKKSSAYMGSVESSNREDYKLELMIPIFRTLSDLMSSSVSIIESLNVVTDSIDDIELRMVFEDILSRVKNGSQMSESILQYPRYFSQITLNLIKVGEENGTLSDRFADIVEFMDRRLLLYEEIEKATLYPKVVLFIVGIILVVLSKFVFPMYIEIFDSLSVELSLFNNIVFGLMTNAYIFVALIAIISFTLYLMYKLNVKFRLKIKSITESIFLKIPVTRNFLLNLDNFYYTEVMAILLNSGVPILKSLKLAKDSLQLNKSKEQFEDVGTHVSQGYSLSETLSSIGFFDKKIISIIDVGERTGELGIQFKNISKLKLRELDRNINTITVLIEPVAYAIIASIVIPVIFSIALPMMQLYKSF